MKVRILENSIRFRLRRSEVAQLALCESILNIMSFPAEQSVSSFTFLLQAGESWSINSSHNRFEVQLPQDIAQQLSDTEIVTVSGSCPPLNILVEKDYTCLIPRKEQNPVDYYPNPKTPR